MMAVNKDARSLQVVGFNEHGDETHRYKQVSFPKAPYKGIALVIAFLQAMDYIRGDDATHTVDILDENGELCDAYFVNDKGVEALDIVLDLEPEV